MRLALALTEEDPEGKGAEEGDPITVAGAVIKIGAKPLNGAMVVLVSFQ
jgi:protocatechuate 3,4-dioxygenase beta subunit